MSIVAWYLAQTSLILRQWRSNKGRFGFCLFSSSFFRVENLVLRTASFCTIPMLCLKWNYTRHLIIRRSWMLLQNKLISQFLAWLATLTLREWRRWQASVLLWTLFIECVQRARHERYMCFYQNTTHARMSHIHWIWYAPQSVFTYVVRLVRIIHAFTASIMWIYRVLCGFVRAAVCISHDFLFASLSGDELNFLEMQPYAALAEQRLCSMLLMCMASA